MIDAYVKLTRFLHTDVHTDTLWTHTGTEHTTDKSDLKIAEYDSKGIWLWFLVAWSPTKGFPLIELEKKNECII